METCTLHEIAIAHVRRSLAERFVCQQLGETLPQFKRRMQQVQDFMNSDDFSHGTSGRGLRGLATALLPRCKELLERNGERLPK